MRKMAIVLVALGLAVATTAYASNPVRISQVYGSGGNYYRCDYVELFNNSGAPVDIGGWSIQYGSATGSSFGSSTYNYALIPAGAVIPACGYYLISGYCSSSAGADLPVIPDLRIPTSPPLWQFNFSSSSGKVALFSDQVFNRTCAQAQAVAVDLVGYGAANCYETEPAPTSDALSVLVRSGGGAADTDDNSHDFTLLTQPVTIHNSQSARNPDCVVAVGACCLQPLPDGCVMVSRAQCAAVGGVYLGDWVPCIPDPCATPAHRTTWGRVKTIYR